MNCGKNCTRKQPAKQGGYLCYKCNNLQKATQRPYGRAVIANIHGEKRNFMIDVIDDKIEALNERIRLLEIMISNESQKLEQ